MRLAIVRSDGGISIMVLSDGANPESEVEKWKACAPEGYVSHHVLSDDDLPQDRTFRNAWKHDGKSLAIDMPKARELWRNRMREARAPKLAALDVEYQRADETGDASAKVRVGKRKQALRDVTSAPEIDAARSTEELKDIWPAILD